MRLTGKRRCAVAGALALAAFAFVCMFSEPTETALEGFVVPAAQQGDDDELMSVIFRDASETGVKITSDTRQLAALLRAEDGDYQAKLEMLQVSDRGSRAHYIATKEALISKMANARRDCQKEFTVQLEQQDPTYMRSFAKLLAHSSTAKLKKTLQTDLSALKQTFHTAVRGQPKSRVKSLGRKFRKHFETIKKRSPYYQAVLELRRSSAWYPTFKSQVASHTAECTLKTKKRVASALTLLQTKSKWFVDYSSLILGSRWYRQYQTRSAKVHTTAALKTRAHHTAERVSQESLVATDPVATQPPSTAECLQEVQLLKGVLAKSLRHADAKYQSAYKALLASEKVSHEKYVETKNMLDGKAKHAPQDCKKHLAVSMETADHAYSAAYQKLLHKPGMLEAKKRLQSDMAALQKVLIKASHGKTGAALDEVKAEFHKKFDSLEQKSSYFTAVTKLREDSAWYPKYQAEMKSSVAKCVAKTQHDVDAAVGLLQKRSKWFTEYGNLIKNSEWYNKYGETLKARAAACNGKPHSKKASAAPTTPAEKPPTTRPIPPITPATSPTAEKDKIAAALKMAQHALAEAKTPEQEKVARAAAESALARAGVQDAKSAGTIAWANHRMDLAKKWATHLLQHQVNALDEVSAWSEGDRKQGVSIRKSTEGAIEAMIAVAQATKNAQMVAQERTDRDQSKLDAMAVPMRRTQEAAAAAEKSVQHAKGALAASMSTGTRIRAKHALDDARGALHDANTILHNEVARRDAVLANRLHSDGARLVGESELHYRARKTFHRGQRVLKVVDAALALARKNHYARKKAMLKREQQAVAEKATKLKAKEKSKKSEQRRKQRGIKTEEEYAAKLADEALEDGKAAGKYMGKAAQAGRIAASKLLEAAEVKASLYREQHAGPPSRGAINANVRMEAGAAVLASKASQMEDSAVLSRKNGDGQPLLLEKVWQPADAREERANAHQLIPSDRDIAHWRSERHMWKKYYKKLYQAKYVRDARSQTKVNRAVQRRMELEASQEDREDSVPSDLLVAAEPHVLATVTARAPQEEAEHQFKQKLGIILAV